ncbi:MAG: xanthine dehydrogenase family protein molybdopterin-binding subunit [Streptosporangiaceae bacterium]
MEYHRGEGSNTSYIGVRIPRREDPALLMGAARTVADLQVPGTVELAFTRSEVAHARLGRVDSAPARGLPGVAGAWSAADLPDLPPAPGPPGPGGAKFGGPERFPLARDVVRFAGEPVAVVAAESRALAEDGAERVIVGLEPLPPLLDAGRAALPDAPPLFPGRSNVVSDREYGAPADDVFTTAPVVVTARYRQQLLIPTSLEGRAVLARPDEDGGFTVWVSHQAQHRLRDGLAGVFGLEPGQVRVVVPMAGGAFGTKSGSYPEYVLACHLARLLGRPVRWVEDRAEALATSTRGRGQQQEARLAATEDGRLLGYELRADASIGAYPHTGDAIPGETGAMATGSYRTPRVYARIRTVLTTTPPTSAYRGAGRPEAAYAIERSMDQLARRLGIDPVELRRRNFIREFPYRTLTGRTYDSGNYEAALDRAVAAVRYDEVRVAQRRRRSGGGAGPRPLGVGVACYVERSGGPPDTDEFGSVEVEPDGSVIARSGSTCTGQAHPTVFPQVVATALEISLDRVRLVQNDTREVPYGFATFGSRSLQVGGGALWRASQQVLAVARQRFATACEVELAEVSYAGGRFRTGAQSVTLGELVQQTGPLRADDRFKPPQAFPFGCYAAVVEVDTELGDVHILRLVAVDDYGVVVNPMIVDGQGYGSIAQGLGQVMFEEASYTPDGLPEASTLLDYLLPTAADMPPVELLETETPNPNVPFGSKGAGEAGCIGVPPAVVSAVCDALDLDHIDMPLTPETVWRAAHPAR